MEVAIDIPYETALVISTTLGCGKEGARAWIDGDGDDTLVGVPLRDLSRDDHISLERVALKSAKYRLGYIDRMGSYKLALEVQVLRVQPELSSGGAVLERVPPDAAKVSTTACSGHDARVVVRRRGDPSDQYGHKELGKVEVSENVRRPLEIVSILGQVVDRDKHHAAGGD